MEIFIHPNTPLTPITEEELMIYCFFSECRMEQSFNDKSICENDEIWEGTKEQLKIAQESRYMGHLYSAWRYAELGIPGFLFTEYGTNKPKSIESISVEVNEWFIEMIRFVGYSQMILAHDGQFGHESTAERYTGAKILYKFLARLKLDYGLEVLDSFMMLELLPHTSDLGLSTVEYGLLAGFSHKGAVRNEISNKETLLTAQKIKNKIVIPIEVARKTLMTKRNFVPTEILRS